MLRSIFKKFITDLRSDTRGAGLLIFVLVFGSVAVTMIILGVSTYAVSEHRLSMRKHQRDHAFHVAEAGINYYRWHLAHQPENFVDDLGLHEYNDKDGNLIGYYDLEVDPPLTGTSIATIRSTGWTVARPEATRTLQVRVGYPALTDYAFVENANMRFSHTTEVHGKVHSNGWIDFDGLTDAPVEAYQYVFGDGGPADFWFYPVPWRDFGAISADLATVRDLADAGGLHLNSSGGEGYHIIFQADATFDLYRVNNRSCYLGSGFWWWWWWIGDVNCYDLGSQTFLESHSVPVNGAIFVEDHVWVDGTVDGRVTIGAGRFPVSPSTYREIYISGNILYEEKSSDDVLGLIAQGDIIVPKNVPDDMEIDAAALSQFRQIYRPYYNPGYGDSIRNSLLFFGSQISYEGGGWKYGSPPSYSSGFVNTNHTYDGNLLYMQPVGFPVGDTYDLISWEEIE